MLYGTTDILPQLRHFQDTHTNKINQNIIITNKCH